jgi:hypothetical protein
LRGHPCGDTPILTDPRREVGGVSRAYLQLAGERFSRCNGCHDNAPARCVGIYGDFIQVDLAFGAFSLEVWQIGGTDKKLDVDKHLSGVDDLAQRLSIDKARVEPLLDKAQIEFLDRGVFGGKFHGHSIGKELRDNRLYPNGKLKPFYSIKLFISYYAMINGTPHIIPGVCQCQQTYSRPNFTSHPPARVLYRARGWWNACRMDLKAH